MTTVGSAYTQLFGIGILWISFHCAGMCGPLLMGLDVSGAGRGQSPLRGAAQILLYQMGRGLTYAWLGGICGLIGSRLHAGFFRVSAGLALVLGLFTMMMALRRQIHLPRAELRMLGRREQGLWAKLAGKARRLLVELAYQPGPWRNLALGAAMGFLPCMITIWALGLAALCGSPLDGALLMLLLVCLTTPVLLTVTLLPHVLPWRQRLRFLAPYLPMLSGLWLVLVGGAGLGLWPHVHASVSFFHRHFMVMFF